MISKMASSLPGHAMVVNYEIREDKDAASSLADLADTFIDAEIPAASSLADLADIFIDAEKPGAFLGPVVLEKPAKKPWPEACWETEGCFFIYASSQCFCGWDYNPEGVGNWTHAEGICTGKKWKLPHPDDAVALRSILVQQCGDCGNIWLNAKYYEQNMVWWDMFHGHGHRVIITAKNPLFPPGTKIGSDDCLQLSVSEGAWDGNRNEPYHVAPCTNKVDVILCEKVY